MTPEEKAVYLIQHPAVLGRALGYTDFRDDLHGVWIKKMLSAKDDITLQAHRGSFKTTCLCMVIALLMIWHGKENIIFLRKTDSDVAEVIKQVDRILNSDIIREIYNALTGGELVVNKSTNTEISLSSYEAPRGAAQLLGIGTGGSLTGKHADVVITDDIINLKDRVSRAERDHTKAIYQELQNVKNRGGRIINCGTPWHKEDAFELMPPPIKFDCYTTGLLTPGDIERLRQSMSPSLFAANYELRHIATENALFETAPIFYEGKDNPLKDGVIHVDAAYGGEDWTAVTCGKRVGDKIYMFGKMWQSHVDTVLDSILMIADKYMCAPLYCEDNADKGFLMKEVRRKRPELPVRLYHEKENKYMKISSYLRKWWSSIIWLPETDREYLAQIQDYTEDAEHDDAPDSASCIARLLDRRTVTEYKPILG